MTHIGILLVASLGLPHLLHAQTTFSIMWQSSLGGSLVEEAYDICVVPTGYLMIGVTASTDGQVVDNHGNQDLWLTHVDETGALTWQRTLGGTNQDRGYGMVALEDGGCVVVGEVISNNGDVSGNHGGLDAWVARLDLSGSILWQRAFGGTGWDAAHDVARTPDGGFLVTGHTKSNNGDVVGHQGNGTYSDYWTLRLSANGELLWQSTIGGSMNDIAHGLIVLPDGGSVIVGESYSQDGHVLSAHGGKDAWVCRLSPEGELLWRTSLGGSSDDVAYDLIGTSDGGMLVVGETSSNDGDVQGAHGALDAWVVKLSATGGLLWQRSLGGNLNDRFHSIIQAGANSYILAGGTNSVNGNTSGNHGGEDTWLVQLDGSGAIIQERCLGGTLSERCRAIAASPQGGFTLAGSSSSSDGDLTFNHGLTDVWVVRILDPTSIADPEHPGPLRLHPNPAHGYVCMALPWIGATGVQLLDMQGRVALRTTADGPEAWIDLRDLPPGMYSVRAASNNGTTHGLLSVE